MGKQFRYHILPEDYPIISTYLAERDMIILNRPFINDDLHQRIRTNIEIREGDWPYYLLCKKEDLSKIQGEQLTNVYYVDTDVSPIVEFDRCYWNKTENYLRQGRIWYQTGYWGKEENYITKDEDFLQWANAFNAWLRKRVVNKKSPPDQKFGESISPAVLKKVQEEGLKLD